MQIPLRTVLTMTVLHISIIIGLLLSVPGIYQLRAISFFFWFLVIAVQFLYYYLSLSNPGVIPKVGILESIQEVPIEQIDTEQNYPSETPEQYMNLEEAEANLSAMHKEEAQEVDEKSEVEVSFVRICLTCQIEQPLRAKHCNHCQKCIALHDHHCPWIGVCIGENNRRVFYLYLATLTLLLWSSSAWVILSFQVYSDITDTILMTSVRGLMLALLVFFALMVTGLLGFQTYLACRNFTTWEFLAWSKISYLNQLDKQNGSPFNKGVRGNLYQYFCESFRKPFNVWKISEFYNNSND